MKATDPNARFSRIVLSSTMLSDHSAPAYVDALEDASQLASVRFFQFIAQRKLIKQGDILLHKPF
jgi:hypothetical protein